VHRIGKDAGVVHQGLVINVQGSLASNHRGIGERDINAAVGNDSAVGRGFLVPVTVYQARSRRDLDDRRAVQFGYVEITQSRSRNVHGSTDSSETALVRVEDPGHIVRPGFLGLSNLHEHADNPTGSINPEDIRASASVELNVGADH